MSNSSLIFIVFIIVVLGIIAMTLKIAISGNVKVGQQFRKKLMERLKQLPFNSSKRNIDVNKYIHDMPVNDLEKQLHNCDGCTTKGECEEALAKEGTSDADYSFCPNDEYLKQTEFTKDESIIDRDDEKDIHLKEE
jgi:hypothetical protein